MFEVNIMKNTQDKKIENDNLAAIGIGAIPYSSLDSRSSGCCCSHYSDRRKLQQNAQSTGDDTTDEMSGKVQLNVFVDDLQVTMLFTADSLLVPMIP